MGYVNYGGGGGGYRRGGGITVIIALIMAAVAVFRYFGSTSTNVVTGQKQHVAGITPQQEIALGLQSEPSMEQQYGGESSDAQGRQRVEAVGERVVSRSDAAKSPYKYQFHLLADPQTVNAFALPGGQVFITEALYQKLKTDGELAGVLGHEVGHVVGRHGAEQIAKQQLTQGLSGAAVLATYDPNNPNSTRDAAVIQMVSQLVNLKYSRNDESAADAFGVKFMSEAGYDPRAMLGVMDVLNSLAGKGNPPEFLSTHPNPPNRMTHIKQVIAADFPNGIPSGLEP